LALVTHCEKNYPSSTNDKSCQSFTDFGSTSKVWTGTNVVAKFIHHGFGPEHFSAHKTAFDQVTSDIKTRADEASNENMFNSEENKIPVLHTNTTVILEGFFTVMTHIYRNDQKFRDDFRVALVRTQEQVRSAGSSGKWMSKGAGGATSLDFVYSANFWCLNPAVIFDELKDTVRFDLIFFWTTKNCRFFWLSTFHIQF
jgi:Fanconi anemia group J protein